MTIEVEGPNGEIVEFPDGTDRNTMTIAMNRRFGTHNPVRADVHGGTTPTSRVADSGDLLAHAFTAGLDTPALGAARAVGNVLSSPFTGNFDPVGAFHRGTAENRAAIAAGMRKQSVVGKFADAAAGMASPIGALGGKLLGLAGATLPRIGAAMSAVSPRVASLGSALADAAGYGAVLGGNDAGKLSGAGVGAASGVVGDLVGRGMFRGASHLISPALSRSADALAARGLSLTNYERAVRTLHNAGVQMTPGQIRGGVTRGIEDAVATVPVLGAPQRSALRNSLETQNIAAIDNAMAPISYKTPDHVNAGRDAVKLAHTASDKAYGDSLDAMSSPLDPEFHAQIADAVTEAADLPDSLNSQFHALMQRHVQPFIGPEIKGRDLQSIKRGLDGVIAKYEGSPAPVDNLMVQPLKKVRDAFMANAERQSPELFAKYRLADQAYRNMAPINAAAAANKADGVVTPFQFAGAVHKKGFGTTTNNLARGEANMQELADAANLVLPAQMKSSGTAERAAILSLMGGGGLASVVSPPLAVSGAAVSLPYAPIARKALQSYMLGGRGRLASGLTDFLDDSAPLLGRSLAPLLAQSATVR